MVATASSTREHASKTEIVVVDLGKPQPSVAVNGLRKGKGKLFHHVERIVGELTEAGTVKSGAQTVVIVVSEIPSPPWAKMFRAPEEDDDD
jgi:Family of unknown function (DUF6200)